MVLPRAAWAVACELVRRWMVILLGGHQVAKALSPGVFCEVDYWGCPAGGGVFSLRREAGACGPDPWAWALTRVSRTMRDLW